MVGILFENLPIKRFGLLKPTGLMMLHGRS